MYHRENGFMSALSRDFYEFYDFYNGLLRGSGLITGVTFPALTDIDCCNQKSCSRLETVEKMEGNVDCTELYY